MKRRFLSTLMALVLALSLIPTAALAADILPAPDDNGVITLEDNISLASADWNMSALFGERDEITIDLNGNTITMTDTTIEVEVPAEKTLTLQNGTISAPNYDVGNRAVFSATTDATIVFDHITMTTTGAALYPSGAAAAVIVRDSNITAGTYVVGTNASTNDTGVPIYSYNVKIMLIDSVFTTTGWSNNDGDDCPVMINVPGELFMRGCTVTGNRQAVLVRAGDATIENCDITLTGKFNGSDVTSWTDGNNVPMAALVVGSQTNAYKANAVCDVVNTTINAPTVNEKPAVYVSSNDTKHNNNNPEFTAKLNISGTNTEINGDMVVADGSEAQKASVVVEDATVTGDITNNSEVSSIALLETVTFNGTVTTTETSGPVYVASDENAGNVVAMNADTGLLYKTLQAAIDEAASGDTVTLLKDIASGAAIIIGLNQDLTLDLGGHTLTVQKTVSVVDDEESNVENFLAHIVNNGDSLVIRNGTIVGDSAAAVIANRSGTLEIKSDATIQSTSDIYNNSAIIVNLGGTVETSGQLISTANCGIRTYGGTVNMTGGRIEATYFNEDPWGGGSGLTIFNRGYNNESAGAKVTISGGTIDAAVFAISTNNLYSGGGNPSNLTITGGTVTAVESSTIYWPSAGTLTIGTKGSTSGPTINSPKGSSVEICSGTLNVYGGTLNGGTEMTSDDSYATDQSLVNGYRKNSGSAGTGDAVTVISRRGSGYDTAQLNVNIEGGTFTSPQNYGVRYMDCNLAESETKIEQTVDVKITGGSFDGGIAAVDAEFVKEDDKDFISGGNYSNSVIDYLTDDMTAQLYSTSDPETPYSYYRDVAAAQNAAGPNDVITDFSPDVGTSVTYYTITLNNGDTVYNKYFIKANGSFTLPSAPSGSSNQRFDGWSLYGTLYQPGQTFTVTKPMTFDAMWTEVSSSGSGSSDPSYSPVLDVSDGGTIKVSPRTPEAGDKVTITPDPDNGYEVGEVTVTDRSGDAVRVTANRDGTYTFTQPRGRVTIEVTFVRAGESVFFDDVPASFWAYDEIAWAYDNGYVNGTSATTFSPNSSITRQQVWMILARLSGTDPASMAAAREWAMANNISDGTNPGNAVTRQQLVALLYRYAQMMGYDNGAREALTDFPDAGTVSGYAQEPMQWSVANGIVAGTSAGTLNPAGTATRAQFAVILYRFWDQVG